MATLPRQMIVTIDKIPVWRGPSGPGTTKLGNLNVNQEVTISKEGDICFYASISPVIGWIETRALKDKVIEPPPEPIPTKVLTHDIDIYDDGSISIDGIPYQ